MRDRGSSGPIRVAVVTSDILAAAEVQEAVLSLLRFDDDAALDAENADDFTIIKYSWNTATGAVATAAGQVAAFGPHVVLAIGGNELLGVVEQSSRRGRKPRSRPSTC